MKVIRFLILSAMLGGGVSGVPAPAAETPQGVRLFYRVLGAKSNGPLLPKSRTICGTDGAETTGQTGMADSGFTEFPFRAGRTSYTFAEQYAFFPRIATGVPMDPSGVNVGDVLVDHVYEPVAIVWGLRGKEFVQTFVATGRELVSLTLLVPSERGIFRAALIQGGPGGRQIGAAKSFASGHSMEWGHVKWLPGEAPLQPGRAYGIRLWRQDGQSWSPYLHATGNCYDDGLLYLDQTPRPESDLGAWIVEEPADLSRALIENVDPLGTVRNSAGFVFVPRTPNVRLITVTASPMPMECGDMFLSIWTTEEPPRRLAGPKRCLGCGPTNGPHTSHFLFTPDELPVVPGQRYRAGFVGWANHKAPRLEGLVDAAPKVLDSTPIVYGEPIPGGLPAIHNLKATFPVTNRTMELTWNVSYPCPVRVEIKRLDSPESEVFTLEPGTDRRVDVDNRVEAEMTAPPGYVITGLGARAHEDNLTTLWLQIRPLQADGTLGPPEELRGGWEPDAHLEAQVTLPEGYAATGFGGRIAPEWDVKTLALWGRPLRADGTLGEEQLFRAGIEPEGGLERQIQLPVGRVLSTVGLNCGFNDLNRIKCASLALGPTATARATERR